MLPCAASHVLGQGNIAYTLLNETFGSFIAKASKL